MFDNWKGDKFVDTMLVVLKLLFVAAVLFGSVMIVGFMLFVKAVGPDDLAGPNWNVAGRLRAVIWELVEAIRALRWKHFKAAAVLALVALIGGLLYLATRQRFTRGEVSSDELRRMYQEASLDEFRDHVRLTGHYC